MEKRKKIGITILFTVIVLIIIAILWNSNLEKEPTSVEENSTIIKSVVIDRNDNHVEIENQSEASEAE